MENAQHLRDLAAWYRAFAEVGRTDERENRLSFAAYLERRADELERRADKEQGVRGITPH